MGAPYILLHTPGRLFGRQSGDLFENRAGVFVTGPQPLEIQDTEAPQPTDGDRGCRAQGGVHSRTEHRQAESEGVDLPGDVNVVRVTRTPARNDGDVVETVGAPARLRHRPMSISTLSTDLRGGTQTTR